ANWPPTGPAVITGLPLASMWVSLDGSTRSSIPAACGSRCASAQFESIQPRSRHQRSDGQVRQLRPPIQ
ncbi:MAG: hypothetical protein U5L06_03515, partial [Rhodovibrio sp.]|nr:hypothetical protein [Rhodovibrio sp.]